MKRWGIIITVFYFIVIVLLLTPAFVLLVDRHASLAQAFGFQFYSVMPDPVWLTLVAILLAGQALLLFLSVDTSWRRLKPRQRVGVTAGLAGFFAATLFVCVVVALSVALYADEAPPYWDGREDLLVATLLGVWVGFWVIWGGIFYSYYRDSSAAVSRIVSWLLKGSVLELLIAVPAHVMVRQRGDCSAPFATGFGIVTGIAIMLLCFGPSVLALYKKRIAAYSQVITTSA